MARMTETPAATLVHLPPGQLAVHKANVRSKVDAGLVESVRRLGVLSPLIVTESDGTYTVVAGHRRRAAAIKADTPTVPCYVLPLGEGADQITAMLVENLAREDLSAADEAKGYEQLSAFGLSDADIAAATGTDVDVVATGLTVARSKVAAKVGRRYDLTLEQSAALAEFEVDPVAVKDLTATARDDPSRFDHEVARFRQDRDRRAKRAAARAELVATGVTITEERPGYEFAHKAGTELSSLRDGSGKEITLGQHRKCPGHAAFIDNWATVTYLCRDPRKHGHRSYYRQTSGPKADLSPAEKEKAAAERRAVIANNKAMDAATPVRRRYVRDLLARKTAPKGTLGLLADLLVGEYPEFLTAAAADVVVELTGLKAPTGYQTVPLKSLLTTANTDARRQVVLLARVAVAIESTWARDLWRDKRPREARYLRYLASTGYGLAPVEQVLLDVAAGKPVRNVDTPEPLKRARKVAKAKPARASKRS